MIHFLIGFLLFCACLWVCMRMWRPILIVLAVLVVGVGIPGGLIVAYLVHQTEVQAELRQAEARQRQAAMLAAPRGPMSADEREGEEIFKRLTAPRR